MYNIPETENILDIVPEVALCQPSPFFFFFFFLYGPLKSNASINKHDNKI